MGSMPRRAYTKEFRAEAVKRIIDEKMGLSDTARRLDISVKTLANWVKLAKDGMLAQIDRHRLVPVSELEAENKQLKRELAEARADRDLLKIANAYFASLHK